MRGVTVTVGIVVGLGVVGDSGCDDAVDPVPRLIEGSLSASRTGLIANPSLPSALGGAGAISGWLGRVVPEALVGPVRKGSRWKP